MNAAQIHLALNHAPLFLSLIGGITLMIGIIKKNTSFRNFSFVLLAVAALFTLPVYFTGEGTEELVERIPGVNEPAIEAHEEMAKISLIVIAITGLFSLAGLLFRKNSGMARVITFIALLLSLVSFGTMAQTAHLGGKIRHSELSTGISGTAAEEEKKDTKNKPGEKDDD